MGLRIRNGFFKVSNGLFRSIETVISPSTGQIFRVTNTGGIGPESLGYTKIDSTTTNTGLINPGETQYILALSGSLYDSPDGLSFNAVGLTITNLLITSSVDESPSFTEELITTIGTTTWTKPAGVTQVLVELWAGGGAGGGVTSNNSGGGGGAGGQYARKLMIYPSAQSNITYQVAEITPGSTGDGLTGADSAWDIDEFAFPVFAARGGNGGFANNGNGGDQDTFNQNADVLYLGGTGDAGFFSVNQAIGGGGGGAAGSATNGAPFLGGIQFGGNGGAQISLTSGGSNGNPGNNYGGGGSGAAKISGPNRSGGDGAQGLIRLIYR